jgi:hypothetical protein
MALSFVTYTGDGAVTSFNVTFPYINKTDVSVLVNEVSTSFTWLSASQVSVSPAPVSGSTVKIKRATNNTTREVDFVDSAVLTESDLDKANEQNFYLSQEAKDDSDIALKQNSTGNWEGQNKTIQNLGTPINDTDAATKTYVNTQTVNAFTSATNAATSEANALTSETNAALSLDHFTDRYLGASATEPVTDLDGQQLLDGALFFNSTDNIMYVYDLGNTVWVRVRPNSTEQADITSVSNNETNINLTANNETNINNVSGSISNVNACASNETNINSAVSNSANINIAANNISDINSFVQVYRIAAADPTTSLTVGDLYYNTTTSNMMVYNGSGWGNVAPINASNLWDKINSTGQQQINADSTNDTLNIEGANEVAITTDASTDTITIGLPTYDAGLLHGTLPSGIGYKTVFFGLNVVNGVLQVTDSEGSSSTFNTNDYMDSFIAGPDTSFTIDSLGHLQITLT